jgi:ABC-type thiamin/hydroxymethylpyrimidine transport system permease subunit
MNAMQPTRMRLLVGIAVISGAVGWGLVRIVDSWSGRLVAVPWLAAGSLWLVAGAVAYWAWSSKPRLQRRPGSKPMDPIVAARSAALAMAASRIGALVTGLYGGIAIAMLGKLTTESGLRTFWAAGVATLGALALTIAALWLEHVCRLPVGPGDPPPAG